MILSEDQTCNEIDLRGSAGLIKDDIDKMLGPDRQT